MYPNKRLDEEEIENGNNDNYYHDIDGTGSRHVSNSNNGKNDYSDPPPTVF